MNSTRKIYFALIAFFLASILFFLSIPHIEKAMFTTVEPQEYNVVLISFDTLRADHLGVYGYSRNTSPNIDRFSEKAFVFKDCYANSPWTLPSHMSILTGLYSSNHGVYNDTLRLKNSTLTLAEVLKDNGYTTAAFTDSGYVKTLFNYHSFDVFDDTGGTFSKNFKSMIDWIKGNSDRKFFLFWHTFRVHAPYIPRKQYDVFTDEGYDGIVDVYKDENETLCANYTGIIQNKCLGKTGQYYNTLLKEGLINKTDIDYVIGKYDGEILTLDNDFSRLIKQLSESGLMDKTIIIVISDHGESFADRPHSWRYNIGHAQSFNEVLRIPLILSYPGLDKQVFVDKTCESTDIMPTVLDLLDIPIPSGLDGISLFEKIGSEKDYPAYSELLQGTKEYVVVFKDHKLIYNKIRDSFEVYDLKNDPLEKNNMFGQDKKLDESLLDLMFSKMKNVTETDEVSIDEDTMQELRRLGYLV